METLGNLPTTIEAALVPSNESRIITEPDEPYRIIHVNEVWCRTCGYEAEEVLGQTCKFLHGPGTCGATLQMLKQALQLKRGLAVQLLNYTKKGRPFMNTLQVAPLYNSSGQVTHYLGVVMARYLDGGGVVWLHLPSRGNGARPWRAALVALASPPHAATARGHHTIHRARRTLRKTSRVPHSAHSTSHRRSSSVATPRRRAWQGAPRHASHCACEAGRRHICVTRPARRRRG